LKAIEKKYSTNVSIYVVFSVELSAELSALGNCISIGNNLSISLKDSRD